MLKYELISQADYLILPTNPVEKWLSIEEICRKSLNGLLDGTPIDDSEVNIKLQYMTTVAAAAEELGIEGIKRGNGPFDIVFRDFLIATLEVSTRLKLRSSSAAHKYSVSLKQSSRTKIYAQIEKLRALIQVSDLPATQKKRLTKKLDELQGLAAERRMDFAKVMLILSVIASGIVGATTVAAEYPDAIANILSAIGEEKEVEEQLIEQIEKEKEQLRLPPPTSPQDDDSIPF